MAEFSRRATYYWPTYLLFVVFAISVFQASDPYFITGFLLALQLGLWGHRLYIRITPFDLVLGAVWLYEALLIFTSVNPQITPFRTLTVTTLYYGCLRIYCNRDKRLKSYFYYCSILLGLMSLTAAVSFYLFEKRILAAGFDDLYHFRFIHNSLGYLGNVWGNLLLCALGISVLALYYWRHDSKRRIILSGTLLPIVWGIIHTFSRGVYIAFGLIALLFIAYVWSTKASWKRKTAYCIIFIGMLFLMCVPHRTEVLRTLRMTETVSQQRSLEGRISGAEATLHILRQHPITGVGSGNYSLAANASLYENDYIPYTPIAPGLAFQLAAEKGVIGTLLWVLLPVLIYWSATRRRERNAETWILVAITTAMLLREFTFPTLFDYAGSQLMLFTLFAAYQNHQPSGLLADRLLPLKRWMRWLPAAICTVILVVTQVRVSREQSNNSGIEALAAGDLTRSLQSLQAAGNATPYCINRGVLHWRIFQQTGDRSHLTAAEQELRAAAAHNPFDTQIEYDLAVVLHSAGNTDSSQQMMRKLVHRFPANALYRVTLYEMLARTPDDSTERYEHLVKAIELAPSLLETPLWQAIRQTDTAMFAKISELFNKQANNLIFKPYNTPSTYNNPQDSKKNTPNNVIKFAHYGKIMFIFNQWETSLSLLNQAVEALPNLSSPWCYMGAIACAQADTSNGIRYLKRSLALAPGDTLANRLLNKYDKQTAQQPAQYKKQDAYPYRFLYRNQQNKFETWYNSRPLSIENIGTSKIHP